MTAFRRIGAICLSLLLLLHPMKNNAEIHTLSDKERNEQESTHALLRAEAVGEGEGVCILVTLTLPYELPQGFLVSFLCRISLPDGYCAAGKGTIRFPAESGEGETVLTCAYEGGCLSLLMDGVWEGGNVLELRVKYPADESDPADGEGERKLLHVDLLETAPYFYIYDEPKKRMIKLPLRAEESGEEIETEAKTEGREAITNEPGREEPEEPLKKDCVCLGYQLADAGEGRVAVRFLFAGEGGTVIPCGGGTAVVHEERRESVYITRAGGVYEAYPVGAEGERLPLRAVTVVTGRESAVFLILSDGGAQLLSLSGDK